MLNLLVAAFALGFVFNATPGPVFAETVRQGVRGGFRAALAVQVGSLVGDAVWAVAGLVGAVFLLQLESLRGFVTLPSIAYLLWLAWNAWRASKSEFAVSVVEEASSQRDALRSGVLLSITNPQNVAYWAAVGSALGALDMKAPTITDNMTFFAGFMVSSLFWAVFVSALIDRVFRNVGVRWAQVTYRLCAVAFLLLALSMVRQVWILRHKSGSVRAPVAVTGKP